MNLEEKIKQITHQTSDINEHIPTLTKYGMECNHITEMGVRGILSTWAFVAAAPVTLRSYDIQHPSTFGGDISEVEDYCKKINVDFTFTLANVLHIDIEKTDLLFIDTWHAYKQLKAELNRHSNKVNKYIILHDTTSFENHDESSYESWGGEWISEGIGLWKAVTEFISGDSEWEIAERFINNNGLTILKRKNAGS